MKRFVDLADLTRDEVLALLELARRLERQPEPRALAGKILGLVFFNPSLRTLASFQAAMARLGGNSLVVNPGQSSAPSGILSKPATESRSGIRIPCCCAIRIKPSARASFPVTSAVKSKCVLSTSLANWHPASAS